MLIAGTARRVVVESVAEVLTAARESRFKNNPTAPAARRIQTVFSLAMPAAVEILPGFHYSHHISLRSRNCSSQ
jgi:hypothetical protein